MKKRVRIQVLRRTLRNLRSQRRTFLECHTIGASGHPRDLTEPNEKIYLAECDLLIGQIVQLIQYTNGNSP